MRKRMKKSVDKGSKVEWKDLPEDILVTIFRKLDHGTFLFRSVYTVCQWWRSVSRPMVFWKGDGLLNLLVYRSIPVDQSHQFLKLLNNVLDALDRKSYSVTRIDFPVFLYITDDHLYYIAQRLPKLQCLNLPLTTNMITSAGFSRAIRFWKEMRGLSIGPTTKSSDYIHVIKELGIHCKNVEHLKLYATNWKTDMEEGNLMVLDEYTSREIANNLCKLKTLCFRDYLLYRTGLENIMSKCTCLEEIDILRCKHMFSSKFRPSSKGHASYKLKKRTTEDTTIEWSVSLRGKGNDFFSTSYIIGCLW